MLVSDGGGGMGIPPGDPGALRAAAASLKAAASAAHSVSGQIKGTAGSLGAAEWNGVGEASFQAAAQRYHGHLDTLTQGYQTVSTALSAYATALDAAQNQARHANTLEANAQSTAAQSFTRLGNQQPPAHATAAEQTAFQSSQARAYQAVNDTLNTDLAYANNLRQQAFIAAHQAAVAAAGQVDVVIGALGPLVVPPPSLITKLADYNDKAGWILNAWGLVGATITSDKTFSWMKANTAFKAASEIEDARFWAWDEGAGGWFAWEEARKGANGAFKLAAEAKNELQESVVPAAGDWSVMSSLGRLGLGAGMASDVITFISPSASFGPDNLLGGNTDRVMAGLNFTASGLALGDSVGWALAGTAMAIPGVDVAVGVVLVGTSVYFAGEFVYQHWDDITHAASAAAGWVGHEAGSLYNGAKSLVNGAGSLISSII
jgi:uncharacterized protein YukE